jgi:hypothetical protein
MLWSDFMNAEFVTEQLFKQLPKSCGSVCENPVTGARFVRGVDQIKPQKRSAYRALVAREWFEKNGPPDAPELPLSYAAREALKHGGLDHIVAWFARSLETSNYDVDLHPSFDDYARGVLASEYAPDFIKHDPILLHRFPPHALDQLGPGLIWRAQKPTARH